MKKIILFLLILLTNFSVSFSCSCLWGGDFFKLSKESNDIVKVEIIGHEKIDGEINEILIARVIISFKGEILMGDTIKLRGDNGASCSPYVSWFKKGSRYIIQFNNSTNYIPYLSNCGEYYLEEKGNYIYSERDIMKELPQVGKMDVIYFEQRLRKSINGFY